MKSIVNPATEIDARRDLLRSDHARAVEGELETQAIAETFAVKFRVDVERRIDGARKVGAHKTSMPRDLERGRPMEIDPLVSVVQEMGRFDTDSNTGSRCGAGAGCTAREHRGTV